MHTVQKLRCTCFQISDVGWMLITGRINWNSRTYDYGYRTFRNPNKYGQHKSKIVRYEFWGKKYRIEHFYQKVRNAVRKLTILQKHQIQELPNKIKSNQNLSKQSNNPLLHSLSLQSEFNAHIFKFNRWKTDWYIDSRANTHIWLLFEKHHTGT